MSTSEGSSDSGAAYELPSGLARYTTGGLWALVAGTVLGLFAFLTNPVPDPSFPWATLPESWRLPFRQSRIEHWPVTYTIAIWSWVFGFPALFLKGFEYWGDRYRDGDVLWLAWLPVVAMYAWTTYCRIGWPKPEPATWNAPSYTFVCWLYCSSYEPIWSNLAFGVATVGLVAAALYQRRSPSARWWLLAFGILALPLGIPALYAAHRASRESSA
jgi:hypothetical protein